MSGYAESGVDIERGDNIPLDVLREPVPETVEGSAGPSSGGASAGTASEDSFRAEPHVDSGRKDFDDGANDLWSIYGKEAKAHDEAQFLSLKDDMDGVLLFAGLFSAVLTSFLVQSLPNLQVNPAIQSMYYQSQSAYYLQQSAATLAQISQQIASSVQQASITSISPRVLAPSLIQFPASTTLQQATVQQTSPSPYHAFQPSISDIRVNICWLVALVCSLTAALLAILVQQWVRSYMQVFQRYDHPLKRARFRQFFFDGAEDMQTAAKAVPLLIQLSLLLFFFGLGDSTYHANTTVGTTTIALICICGSYYLYYASEHLRNPKSPFQTVFQTFFRTSFPFFRTSFHFFRTFFQTFISRLEWIQAFRRPPLGGRSLPEPRSTSLTKYQENLVMENTEDRKVRDISAIRWLVDNNTVNAEVEPLVLAIPGSFNTEWGREVWTGVSFRGLPGPTNLPPAGGQAPSTSPSPPEGSAASTICRCVSYLFETCSNRSNFQNEEARRRRMRACVEAAASLVCCIDFQLEWLGNGKVGKLVSEIGQIENINQAPTNTSDPSFIVRWTCLSLVTTQRILGGDRLKVLAEYAVSGLARFQSDYGQPDEAGWRGAQNIEICLKTAWEHVGDLHQAFEPWTQKRTREEVEEILRNHERQISELERIKVVADSMEEVDWRISLYLDAMDDATFKLTRQLPGVSFDEPRRSGSFLMNDTFNIPATGSTPVTPQLIFPGQRVRALTSLGLKLREVLDGHVAEGYDEVLESLEPVGQVPISLRRPDGLMKRQLWRLQDVRDGRGLGYTVELFFLSLRQLLSIPSLHESNSVFYVGTFKIITSHWEEGKKSLGTQHILLGILCDLIIPGRVFSDLLYPEAITTMLLNMVCNILQDYTGPNVEIRDAMLRDAKQRDVMQRDAVQEIESVDPRSCMDTKLRSRALKRMAATAILFDSDSVSERHVVSSFLSTAGQENQNPS